MRLVIGCVGSWWRNGSVVPESMNRVDFLVESVRGGYRFSVPVGETECGVNLGPDRLRPPVSCLAVSCGYCG